MTRRACGVTIETLGRDQPVRDFARVLVQQGHRRHELTNQAERRVDVELQVPLVRDTQDVRQPRALDVVGDDRPDQAPATCTRSMRRTRA